MSRIDEALRRPWADHVGSGPHGTPSGDAAGREPFVFGLDEYPREPEHVEPPPHVAAEREAREAGRRSESKLELAVVRPFPGRGPAVEPPRATDEQHRRLAATLTRIQGERAIATILVTNIGTRDERTQTAIDLARILSEVHGRRVLIVDGDLREPSIDERLDIHADRGLVDALVAPRGDVPVIEISPLLSVLPAGRRMADPDRVLASDRMRTVLGECAARFDWVIVDAPCAMPGVQPLVRATDATVFVIAAGASPFSTVERAMASIGRERIVATVLTGVGA